MAHPLHVLIVPFLLSLPACGSEEDTGEAPELSNLQVSADGLTVGTQAVVNGTVDFIDADADLDQLEITLTLPSGPTSTAMTELVGQSGQTEGQAVIALSVLPPEEGVYEISVVVIDIEGNESNPVDGEFTVAP